MPINYSKITIFIVLLICTSIPLFFIKVLDLDILNEEVFDTYWQILDLPLLFSEPIQSILYLHSQPPLLNTLIFFLNILGGSLYNNFVLLNAITIGIISIIIFKILYERIEKFKFAFFISIIFSIFPSTMLYITYSFYPCITALGYAILIYSFYISKKRLMHSLLLFSFSIIYLSLTRSSFSFLHVFFFMMIYLFYIKPEKKKLRIYLCLFIVSFICLFVPIKNYILYDFFGSSSWAPINITHGVGIQREGGYWLTPVEIQKKYPNLKCQNSYHIQDATLIKSNGNPNFNSCLYVEYSKIIKNEKLSGYKLLTHAKYFLANTIRYFSPSDKYRVLSLSRDKISSYSNLVNYAQITIPIIKDYEISLLRVFLLIMGFVLCIVKRDKFITLCVITITVHWVTHAATDGYESARFVFDIEFIFFILFGLLIEFLFFKNNIEHIEKKKIK